MGPKDVLEQYGARINQHDFDVLVPLIAEDAVFWFNDGSTPDSQRSEAPSNRRGRGCRVLHLPLPMARSERRQNHHRRRARNLSVPRDRRHVEDRPRTPEPIPASLSQSGELDLDGVATELRDAEPRTGRRHEATE